jgi:hypothetical protein
MGNGSMAPLDGTKKRGKNQPLQELVRLFREFADFMRTIREFADNLFLLA